MSPASRSKAKDKKAAAKEQQKNTSKAPSNTNVAGGVPTSGYNPLLGTFHMLDTAPISTAPLLHVNARFRNFDETDDHNNNSGGTGVEYDSVSNNGSWSGESEDHKEKGSQPPSRQEAIPGADSDKREKIRQKNEKKHQRQKERRAQELHEKCSGYLMSRKLEALAQQLVSMGFSSERATMALILNEGRMEASVAWLFDAGEEADNLREHNNLDGSGNLKIDISEELARIADMEIKFKCSKQEVERAIVACEGDIDQAAETLRTQKQDLSSLTPKPDETGDPPTANAVSNGKISQNSSKVPQSKPTVSPPGVAVKQKRDEKDFNYTKAGITVGSSLPVEAGNKSMQLLKKIQPKTAVPPLVEKRWPPAGSSNPSVSSFSLPSPLQAPSPQSKTEARYVGVANELKSLQLGSVREPVVVMQRPQPKQLPTTSGVEPLVMKPNGLAHIPTTTRSFSPPNNQFFYQQQQQQQQYVSSSSGAVDPVSLASINHGSGLFNRMVGGNTSPTLAAASSLGLFSGLGSNGHSSGPASPVDWNTGGSTLMHLDYTNIDWTLYRAPSSSSRSSELSWLSGMGIGQTNESRMGGMKPMVLSNGFHPASVGGTHFRDGVAAVASESSNGGGGSREWSSPFEERDLFSLPRQFVSSPSL